LLLVSRIVTYSCTTIGGMQLDMYTLTTGSPHMPVYYGPPETTIHNTPTTLKLCLALAIYNHTMSRKTNPTPHNTPTAQRHCLALATYNNMSQKMKMKPHKTPTAHRPCPVPPTRTHNMPWKMNPMLLTVR
jgi:hypothetical protein